MGAINPGTFDRRVNLYRQSIVRTASGEVVKSFGYHSSCFASVESKTLGEETDAAVRPVCVRTLTTHRIPELDNSWRVEIDGEMYEIVSADCLARRYTQCVIRRLNV